MKQAFNSSNLKIVVLPVLGALGALIALVWPVGYSAFCAGLNSLVI